MKVVLIFPLIGFALAVCPPAEILAPCTCNEQALRVSCQWIQEDWDIKETFDQASPHFDQTVLFSQLDILDTSLCRIESNSISSLKFLEINIEGNPGLEYISPDAFNATYGYTTGLSLWNNRLKNDGQEESDIFHFLNKFIHATNMDVALNELSSVPANAFTTLPLLQSLTLSRNVITSVQAFAFNGLTNLESLSLSGNRIKPTGIHPDAFQGMSPCLSVLLGGNPIDWLDEEIFKTLLNTVIETSVGGRYCGLDGVCKYDHLICDSRADWICNNSEFYRERLSGFMCSDDENIFDYCVQLL